MLECLRIVTVRRSGLVLGTTSWSEDRTGEERTEEGVTVVVADDGVAVAEWAAIALGLPDPLLASATGVSTLEGWMG